MKKRATWLARYNDDDRWQVLQFRSQIELNAEQSMLITGCTIEGCRWPRVTETPKTYLTVHYGVFLIGRDFIYMLSCRLADPVFNI